jgi:predicted nucleic acid-binding protein
MANMMLDTNAFNRALDSGIKPASLAASNKLFVTHVQQNELQATRNSARLRQLLDVFTAVPQETVPTAAAVWDVSEWDGAEWGDAGGSYPAMLTRLNQLNGSKPNNAQDILIGVTALKRGYVLVTEDGDLTTLMREFGGHTIRYEDFAAHAR